MRELTPMFGDNVCFLFALDSITQEQHGFWIVEEYANCIGAINEYPSKAMATAAPDFWRYFPLPLSSQTFVSHSINV